MCLTTARLQSKQVYTLSALYHFHFKAFFSLSVVADCSNHLDKSHIKVWPLILNKTIFNLTGHLKNEYCIVTIFKIGEY